MPRFIFLFEIFINMHSLKWYIESFKLAIFTLEWQQVIAKKYFHSTYRSIYYPIRKKIKVGCIKKTFFTPLETILEIGLKDTNLSN